MLYKCTYCVFTLYGKYAFITVNRNQCGASIRAVIFFPEITTLFMLQQNVAEGPLIFPFINTLLCTYCRPGSLVVKFEVGLRPIRPLHYNRDIHIHNMIYNFMVQQIEQGLGTYTISEFMLSIDACK